MRSPWLAVWSLSVVAALCVGACGDDEPDVDDPVSASRTVAEAFCRLQGECCRAGEERYPTFEACVTETSDDLEDGVKTGEADGHPYDPACATAALEAIEAFGCSGESFTIELICETGFCGGLNRGDPAGSSCNSDFACGPGLRCNAGVCEPRCELPEGSPCAEDGQPFATCATGSYCHPETDVCTRVPAIGEPCPDGTCATDARCTTGGCAALLANGDPCSSGLDCASGYCEATACATMPGSGDPCPLSTCGDGLFCVDGSCRPPLGLGQPCAGAALCDEHLTCHEGACVPRPGLGEACSYDGPECDGEMTCLDVTCGYSASPWCEYS